MVAQGMTHMDRIILRSPAKINLHLRVLSRRPDGYHNIRTLFQAIDLFDELILERSKSEVSLEVPGFPSLETWDNLTLKAHKKLKDLVGHLPPVRILLEKNIPIGGGLGGGSSNAAAALIGLNKLFDLGLGLKELLNPATELGADVPFFLIGGSAIGEGIGADLRPVNIDADYELLLVNTGVSVDTAGMFRQLSAAGLTQTQSKDKLMVGLNGATGLKDILHNDFQELACNKHREIRKALEILEQFAPGRCLMSGSGGVVFGLFEKGAIPWDQALEVLPRDWRAIRAKPINGGVAAGKQAAFS
jgi:4-diphosphocytidyl-2-C-methyl-D-erythritol kinase